MSRPEVKLVVSEINTIHNIHCDAMSRGASPLSLGYHQSVILDLKSNPVLQRWIDKMDPSETFDLLSLNTLWTESDGYLQSLLQHDGGWHSTQVQQLNFGHFFGLLLLGLSLPDPTFLPLSPWDNFVCTPTG
jgi:hypothetical protein